MAQMQRQNLQLRNSINTDSINEDTYQFTDGGAPLVAQTGIERQGGIMSLYQTETILAPNSISYVAPSGETITKLSDGTVLVDDAGIGNVSPYGVQVRSSIANVDDVMFSTAADTYITCGIVGNVITLTERYVKSNLIVTENIPSDPLLPSTSLVPAEDLFPSGEGGIPKHQIQITFPGLSSTIYTSLSFVRTSIVDWYSTTFQFALRQGDSVKILSQRNPSVILTIPALLAGFVELNQLYVWQFENSAYFVNLQGNSNNQGFITDSGFSSITETLRCKWAYAQVHNGKSRILLTCDPLLATDRVESIGYIGYYDFVSYIALVQWVGPANGSSAGGMQPLSYNSGYGYSEYTQENSSGNYYNFNSPAFDYNGSIQYNFWETQNKETLYNYYGKLTNVYTLTPSVPFEFRVCWVKGVQSYISVALYDSFPNDHLGVMLTEFGAFSDVYTPQIKNDDSTVLYKDGDTYYIIRVAPYTDSALPQIQQISASAFKLNTISPTNILDLPTKTLLIGSCDYNGRMAFSSTGPIAATATRVVSSYTGKYSNGIDAGEVLVDITDPTSDNIEVIGFRVDGLQTFEIDTYIAPSDAPASTPVYAFSTTASGAELIDPAKTDTLYSQNIVIPLALGDTYNQNVVLTEEATIFYNLTNPVSVGTAVVAGTSQGYDGYTIGNDIPGKYISFRLQGQQYLQDDTTIYRVDLQNTGTETIYGGKSIFCPSTGAIYIASSPTEIYFYSYYDKSIYTFTGNATLQKFKRMNTLPEVDKGVFSVRDNTLLLNTPTSFIWVRDEVVTMNPKTGTQTGDMNLYETSKGIVITNTGYAWSYNYLDPTVTPAPSGTTYSVVPLVYQSCYYGAEGNIRIQIPAWYISVYNPDRTKVSFILDNWVQDLDTVHHQQKYININPQDYTEQAYARFVFRPDYPACLRASIGVSTAEHIQIQEIVCEYTAVGDASVAARRSR